MQSPVSLCPMACQNDPEDDTAAGISMKGTNLLVLLAVISDRKKLMDLAEGDTSTAH